VKLCDHCFGAALEEAHRDHPDLTAASGAGRVAALAVMREVVRAAVARHGWNLSHAGADLGVDASGMSRLVRYVGLGTELAAAKARGLARQGRPPKEAP
jgi:hypothetical protein